MIRRTTFLAGALAILLLAAVPPTCYADDPFAVTAPLASRAVFSCSAFTMSTGSVDSAGLLSTTPTSHGDVQSNGNVTLSGGAIIKGNAIPGPRKTVVLSGGSSVTGTTTSAASLANCTPVDLASLATTLQTTNDNATIPKTAQGKNPLGGPSHTEFVMSGGRHPHAASRHVLLHEDHSFWRRNRLPEWRGPHSLRGTSRVERGQPGERHR
ncbi:MAG: hypothetical protein ABI837_05990 [Acidobacteriota bacterium]